MRFCRYILRFFGVYFTVPFFLLSVIDIKNEILEFQVICLEVHNAVIHMEGWQYGEQGNSVSVPPEPLKSKTL